jgi:hypothetical protein
LDWEVVSHEFSEEVSTIDQFKTDYLRPKLQLFKHILNKVRNWFLFNIL